MNVRQLCDIPDPELAHALAEFEAVFRYPLGPDRSFRISHGDDYPRFFRALGEAACFIAEHEGRVVGAVGVAIRRLLMPDGTERRTGYVGDLKVAPEARTSLAFLQLAWAAQSWLLSRVDAGFGVVMDGTAVLPTAYMGRAGLPGTCQLAKVIVLRITCPDEFASSDEDRYQAEAEPVAECYRNLSRGRYGSPGGTPAERSLLPPVWLLHPDGLACGRLEDTRRAKRLIDDTGAEMVSGHLAAFAFGTAEAGANLIRVALQRARSTGLPALFVSVADTDAVPLCAALTPLDCVVAPATVFGVGLEPGFAWNVNSSEI